MIIKKIKSYIFRDDNGIQFIITASFLHEAKEKAREKDLLCVEVPRGVLPEEYQQPSIEYMQKSLL